MELQTKQTIHRVALFLVGSDAGVDMVETEVFGVGSVGRPSQALITVGKRELGAESHTETILRLPRGIVRMRVPGNPPRRGDGSVWFFSTPHPGEPSNIAE